MRKILYLNSLVLPFFTVVSFSLLLIEGVTYPGFIAKHIFINSNILIMINFIQLSLYFFISIPDGKNINENKLLSLVFNMGYLLLPVLVIIYIILISVESKNYPNYIYANLHINLETYFKAIILQTVIILFGIVITFKNISQNFILSKKQKKENFKKYRLILVIPFLVLIAYQILFSFFDTTQILIKNNVYILNNLGDNYDLKMYKSWHFFYKYMKFVIDNTPSDAKIAIPPPIRPWLSEGNSVLVRYFLYPRYLVTVENENKAELEPDYYLITKGLWKAYNDDEYGWPREKITASEIIYFNSDFSTTKIKGVIFDPDDEKNKYGWGLLKVKKI